MKGNKGRREVYVLILLAAVLAAAVVQAQPFESTGVKPTETAQEGAFRALLAAEQNIQEMQDEGLGVQYVQDVLIEAKDAFQGENFSGLVEQIKQANRSSEKEYVQQLIVQVQSAVQKGKPTEPNYTRVLEKTQLIQARKEYGILLKDHMAAADLEIAQTREEGIDVSSLNAQVGAARREFADERYEETERLLNEFGNMVIDARSEATRLRTVYKAGRANAATFVKENAVKLLVASTLLIAVLVVLSNRLLMRRYNARVQSMELESSVLTQLMKKAQADYYTKAVISRKTFDVKMADYKDRMMQIKRELPVLKEKMRKLRGKRIL